jgi:hypothetical protein
MSKLENIPKKTVFTVPDGYFDKLPADIQYRVSAKDAATQWSQLYSYSLRYALPLVVVAAVVFYYAQSRPDTEAILATVETTDLILFIHETTPTTTEDLLEGFDISFAGVEAIENEVYDLDLGESGDHVLEMELNNL